MSEAEAKFWGEPVLMEHFVVYCDPTMILHLMQSSICCIKDILEDQDRKGIWDKLIRRTLTGQNLEESEGREERERASVRAFALMLKSMKKPEGPMMALLELICQMETHSTTDHRNPQIRLNCPGHPEGHWVSSRGFLLLEDIEGESASTIQKVEKIQAQNISERELGLMESLYSRIKRQQGEVATKMCLFNARCDTVKFAKVFHDLHSQIQIQKWDTYTTCHPPVLTVEGEIEEEGWELLEKAVSKHPGIFRCLATTKEVILRASTEALKRINEALDPTAFKWSIVNDKSILHDNVDPRVWSILSRNEKCILHDNSEDCIEERLYNAAASEEGKDKEFSRIMEFFMREKGLQ